MPRVAELLARGADLPGDESRREAEVLLCAALQRPRSYLFAWPEAEVAPAIAERYERWLAARREGRPIAYLLGQREFWSLNLAVSESTLIPRADTERLVEYALGLGLPADAAVVDLGTGSGAIALALARERPQWRITAVDVSAEALAVAKANAAEHGCAQIEFCLGSWFQPIPGKDFSLIVSNPPYLAVDDPHLAQGDLRFEPPQALVAGADGLDDFRCIVDGSMTRLKPGGWLLLEHGSSQGPAVRGLLQARGFVDVVTMRDLAAHERVSAARRPAGPPLC